MKQKLIKIIEMKKVTIIRLVILICYQLFLFHGLVAQTAIHDSVFNREIIQISEAYFHGGYIKFKIQNQYVEGDSSGIL